MDYRSKILEFMHLNTKGGNGFVEWVKTFPEMQQVELMRELNKMTEEMAAEKGLIMKDYIPNYERAEETLNTFEDTILSKKQLEDYLESINDRKDKLKAKMISDIEQNRMYVISSIMNDASNALEMKEFAKQIIAAEKKLGIYNPETWEGIE